MKPRRSRRAVGAATLCASVLVMCGAGVAGPKVYPVHRTSPVVAVVGASIAWGEGASPGEGWADLLADRLGVQADVSADPGAGFVATGWRHGGPMSRLLPDLDLDRLHPALVLVQAGHNDIGTPLPDVTRRVTALFDAIREQTPHSVVGLISVFPTGDQPSAAARATDAAIVAAARAAWPGLIVFDPITGRWRFPRLTDGLHPTEEGHHWIAARLAGPLQGALDRGRTRGPEPMPSWPDLLNSTFGSTTVDSRQGQPFHRVVTAFS